MSDSSAIDKPRELLYALVDEKDWSVKNTRLRKLCVEIGDSTPQITALVELLQAENQDPLIKIDTLRRYVMKLEEDTKHEIEDINTRIGWIYGPAAAAGLATMTGGAIGVIATLGTGGAMLIAFGGMALFGFPVRGIHKQMQQRRALQGDATVLRQLREELDAFRKTIVERQKPASNR